MGCGNDLNAVSGKAAMEGWMNAKYITIKQSGDPAANESHNKTILVTANSPKDGFLALRDLPDSGAGARILKIPHGAQIAISTCLDYEPAAFENSGRWCTATYKEYSGWVFDAFVTYPDESPGAVPATNNYIEVTVNLNGTVNTGGGPLVLRSAPGLSSPQLGTIPHGANIFITTCRGFDTFRRLTGRWCSTTFNGKRGWVFEGFIVYRSSNGN
jgi:uncharacterized protein YraI